MKEKIQNSINYLNGRVEALRGEIANAISDEARTEIETRISELEQVVSDLRELEATASEGETDNTEEMRTQMREILARVQAVEESVKPVNNETETKMENQVKSLVKNAKFAQAFLDTVRNSATAKEFRANWKETASKFINNNIDANNVADFMPAMVVNEVRDQFVGKRHRLLELVDWTGLPVFKSMWETQNDMAAVHTPGTQKTEQGLAFTPIEITPALVYKYIRIDRYMEKMSEAAGGALLRYITRELVDRLLATIENYILTGTAPFNDPTETDVVQDANSNDIYDALAYMEDTEGAVALMSPTVYLSIKAAVTGLNNRLATHDDVLSYLGVEEIIFNKSTYTPVGAGKTWTGVWYMRPSDYKLVGDRRPDEFEDFNLEYNQKEYLTEIMIGGGCVVPNNFIALVQ